MVSMEGLMAIETGIIAGTAILTCAGYPSWVKIAMIKITGKKYIFSLSKDRTMRIMGGKSEEGAFKTKQGIYELEPDDAFSFNGTQAAQWYAPYNKSAEARVMPLLRQLKEYGINDYNQLCYLTSTPIDQIRNECGDATAEKAETLQSHGGIVLKDLEIVRISDLKNFIESRSPATENGIIERYVSIERRKMGNPLSNTNTIIMLIMAALLGACMGYILGGSTGAETAAIGSAVNGVGGLTQVI